MHTLETPFSADILMPAVLPPLPPPRPVFKTFVQMLTTNGIYRAATMTDLTINSKLRMNSGYDIPILGYGVGMLVYV